MHVLTKEQLINAAIEAKASNGYVEIYNSCDGIKVVVKPVADYPKERDRVLANPDFIKAIKSDSILKYGYDNWDLQDCSIEHLIEQINKKYGPKPSAGPGRPPKPGASEPPIGCPKCLTLTAEFEEATGIIENNGALKRNGEELPDDYPAKKYVCSSCHTRVII
jgi:hypothetical protein